MRGRFLWKCSSLLPSSYLQFPRGTGRPRCGQEVSESRQEEPEPENHHVSGGLRIFEIDKPVPSVTPSRAGALPLGRSRTSRTLDMDISTLFGAEYLDVQTSSRAVDSQAHFCFCGVAVNPGFTRSWASLRRRDFSRCLAAFAFSRGVRLLFDGCQAESRQHREN